MATLRSTPISASAQTTDDPHIFFPKIAAWDNGQKSLKAEFDPSVWEHSNGHS